MSDRPTPTQAFRDLAMAVATRPARAHDCTVDLTLNAKGEVQIAVSAQGPADVVGAVGKAVEAEFDRLCAKYPRAVVDRDEELANAKKAAKINAIRARSAGAT